MSGPEGKLPVPAPWQPAVEAAMADLSARLGLAPSSIAPTRVDDGAGPDGRSLAVWLMAGGRTWRYLADPDGGVAPDVPAAMDPPSA